MTEKRNNLGFSAKVEYSKNRVAVIDGEQTRTSLNGAEFLPLAPNLLFVPINFQNPEQPQDGLKVSDLIFCERPDFFRFLEDCPSCVPNPLAFRPDWRTLNPGENFFDPTKCKYSIVIDTPTTTIPEEKEEINALKLEGILRLLSAYNKSPLTTTVYYVLNNQTEPTRPNPDRLLPSDYVENGEALNIADFENVGAPLDSLIQGDLASVKIPRDRKGYIRLLLEEDTALILLETFTKTGVPAVDIEYFAPSESDTPTRALVSIDAETFTRIPDLIVTTPDILREAEEDEIEVTINGGEYLESFRETSEALVRANKYATEALTGPGVSEEGRFYYLQDQQGTEDVPIIIDFESEANKLRKFQTNYLTPAIQQVLGIRLSELDKVRITFKLIEETNRLQIIEVVANAIGCEEVKFSEFININEVASLFNYSLSTANAMTLGYVAAIPDMLYYIRGQGPIVWLEFIVRFTFPQVVFRTPLDLVTLEDDRNLAECAAQKTGISIVNDVLNKVLDVPDLMLDGLTQSICRAAADIVEDRRTEEQIITESLQTNVKLLSAQLKAAKKDLRNIEKSIKSGVEEDALLNLEAERDLLKINIESIQASLSNATAVRKQTNSTRREEQFRKDLEKKLRQANSTLSSKPLAKIITNAILYGIEEAAKEKDIKDKDGVRRKLLDLDAVQSAIDLSLGGWCGITRLILEAVQCLFNGISPEEMKKKIVEQALRSIKPHQVANFLRALGIRDPERVASFEKKLAEVTKSSLGSLLGQITDISATDTYNFGRNVDQEIDAILSAAETGPVEIKVGDETLRVYPEQSGDQAVTVVEIEHDDPEKENTRNEFLLGQGDQPGGLTEKKIQKLFDKQVRPTVKNIVRQNRNKQLSQIVEPTSFDEPIELALELLPPATAEALKELGVDGIQTSEELKTLILSLLEEVFSIDELFEFLSEGIPGFKFVQFIQDLECLIPTRADLNPPLGLNLKSLNLDLCQLNIQTGDLDFTFPKFNPPLRERDQKVGATIKNFFALLGDYLFDLIVDIATQLLIQALVSIIESVLDLACELIATAGAGISDAISGNSNFREELRQALCPTDELTDQEFAQAMINVFGALSNSNSGQSCVENLTRQEMGDFLDSILVTLSYNQLYGLLIGNANQNVYDIVANLAKVSGSPCIAEIYSDPNNVSSYFSGLGALIGAEDVFDSFPSDVFMQDNLNICPPDAQDIISQIRSTLLSNRGLNPEQIKDQLDFAKEMAVKKMEDLVNLLREGPYKDLPSLLASGDCPPSGLLRRDPSIAASLDIGADTLVLSIEDALTKDLIGTRGLLPRILSDSEGQGLRFHRTLTNGFLGNPVGRRNIIYQFYSDDSLVYSELDLGNDGELSLDIQGKVLKRVDQYGNKYPRANSIFQPIGGFPPTVGAYLYDKLKKYKIGYDPEDEDGQIVFKTRLFDPEVAEARETAENLNTRVLNKRRQFIAKWAAATGFVPYDNLREHLIELKDGMPVLDGDGNTIPLLKTQLSIDYLNANARSLAVPILNKRIAIYTTMIEACNRALFSSGITYRDYSPEDRAKRILNSTNIDKKNLNINGKIVGMSKLDFTAIKNKKKFKNLDDSVDRLEIINSIDNILDAFTFAETFLRPVSYTNINLNVDYLLTQEIRQIYLDIAQSTYNNEFRPIPIDNPYELATRFIPYGVKKSLKKGTLNDPDIEYKLTYDVNPQDEEGNFSSDKYSYRVQLIETINPFSEKVETIPNRVQLQEIYEAPDADPDVPDAPIFLGAGKSGQTTYKAILDSTPSPEVLQYVEEYIGGIGPADVTYSYETEFIRSWLSRNVNEVRPQDTSDGYLNSVLEFSDFINQGFFRRISNRIAIPYDNATAYKEFHTPNVQEEAGEVRTTFTDRKVNISRGFLFGYDPASQPEAIVLDPARYGGTEFRPPFYLEPPKYDGWLGLLQKFIPQEEGCEPRRIPLYDMLDIQQESQEMFNRLTPDERLRFKPLCTKEAPYDLLRDRTAITSIETVIRATTRVHVIDFLVKAIPVFTQFSLNLEGNYDNLLESYLTEYVTSAIKEDGFISPTREIFVNEETKDIYVNKNRIPTNKYYLNFLESAVSNILQKVSSGIIDPEVDMNATQRKALQEIQSVIEKYYSDFDGTEAVISEEAIQAQDMIKRAISPVQNQQSSLGRGSARFSKTRARRIKIGMLYKVIRETQEQAKILFSLYIKKEFEALRERLNMALEPTVDDLSLLLVSDPLFINGHARKRSFERGTVFPSADLNVTEAAEPVYATRPDGTIEYEVPFDVPRIDPLSDKLISNIDLTPFDEDIDDGNEWPFVLEKYIKIEEKEDAPAEILNRPEYLKGVVNLGVWIKYIGGLDNKFRKERISDLWESWSFGLRLSMVFKEEDSIGAKLHELGIKPSSIAQRVTLQVDDTKRVIVPIAAGELEVVDQVIGESATFTTIVGIEQEYDLERQYDTLCLINELVKETEYKTFFEYVFPLKRYLSFMTVYVSNAFYLSIGNAGDASPDEEGIPAGDRWTRPGGRVGSSFRVWNKNNGNFNRSRRLLRGTFIDLFNTLNKDPSQRRLRKRTANDNADIRSLLDDLIPESLLNGMPWWQRRNRVNKPFDMFEGECQDEEDYF